MALRVREDGRVLCAAMHPPQPGDTYLHDELHYRLSVELGVLVTEPMGGPGGRGGHAAHGEWWWSHEVPDDVVIEQWHDGRTFGLYRFAEQDAGHLVITRIDGEPAEPGWYELQTMARMAWGQGALAVEIFPPGRELVDGQHQRHLWLVPDGLAGTFPSLCDGRRWVSGVAA